MKKLLMFLCVMLLVFAITGMAKADLIHFEAFEDSSGITITGGDRGYWDIAPLGGTEAYPSYFTQGGSQAGNIFFGSDAKDSTDLSLSYLMTIDLPDLTGYTNIQLTASLAANGGAVWEPTHRDSLHIIGGTPDINCIAGAGCMPVTGAIDSFLPSSYPAPLRSQVYSIDLQNQFQDFTYGIDSGLASLTFAFASTADYEVVGIDSVAITGDVAPVPEPATMLLLVTGLVGLAGSRIRRKKKA